jgi:hypothetical protein
MTLHPGSTRAALVALLVVSGLPGCRGCGSDVTTLDADFRVDPGTQALDFGRALEGTRVTRAVLLLAETRASVIVTAAVGAPFRAPTSIEVPGGGQVEVPVTFTAGDGEATGILVLRGPTRTIEVSLRGTGVRPPSCTPSGPCLVSSYVLEEDRCVEARAPDETACDPGNVCLAEGRCRAGLCLGVARTCDDGDACTTDGCSMLSGCVNTARSCPPPADPCRVATCNPSTGCGDAPAPDGTICGAVDCVSGSFCLGGGCRVLPTPDGFPCAPAVACLPEGRCQQQVCQRADAGAWLPSWSARLPGAPSSEAPALLAAGASLYFTTCGMPAGAELADGGADAGLSDGGAGDAGEADGGVCALASWTASGFERFVTPYARDAVEGPRRLLNLSPRGVLLATDGGLELRRGTTGALVDAVAAQVQADAVAVAADGGVHLLLDDGTLALWSQAGLTPVLSLGGPGVLALDVLGALYAWDVDAGVLSRVLSLDDGGLEVTALRPDAGGGALIAVAATAVVGGRQQLTWLPDGGVEARDLSWTSPAGVLQEALPRGVLASPDSVVAFARRCPAPLTSCLPAAEETWARVTDSSTGLARWEARVLPADAGGRLEEVALIAGARGAFAALVQADFAAQDAGAGAFLQLFSEGRRELLCPLPAGSSSLRGALFASGRLFVLVDGGDAGVRLEAYELNALPLSTAGWPQAAGVEGQRRAAP